MLDVFQKILQILIIIGLVVMFLLFVTSCEADHLTDSVKPELHLNPLNRAGESDVNIVFVPEGYTAGQMDSFRQEVSVAWEILRSTKPYSYCLDKMNVYYTTELASDSDTLGIGRTVFGLGAPKELSAHADICYDSIQTVMSKLPFSIEKTVLVVMAHIRTPNLGYTLLTVPSGMQHIPEVVVVPSLYSDYAGPALIHEMGHAIGLLADEYFGNEEDYVFDDKKRKSLLNHQEYGAFLNVSVSEDVSEIGWYDFIDDNAYEEENIGIYEGGNHYPHGVWRSTENSVMRHHFQSDAYNAFDRYLICKRIEQMHSGREIVYSEWRNMDIAAPKQSLNWSQLTGTATRTIAGHYFTTRDYDFNDVVIVE